MRSRRICDWACSGRDSREALESEGGQVLPTTPLNSAENQDAEDQGSEEDVEGGRGLAPLDTSQNQQISSSPADSPLLISLQEGDEEGRGEYRFSRDVVCHAGVPSFQKLVNVIAGTHNIHPSKVAVSVVDDEGASNAQVKNDVDLMSQFQAFCNEELRFNVAFTKPSFLNVAHFGEEEASSFRVSGSTSFDTLLGMVAAKYGGDAPGRMESSKAAITSQMDLVKLLHSTPNDEVEIVAFPPNVKSLDLSSATMVGGCMLMSDQPLPYLRLHTSDALWALRDLSPGVYKATLELANGVSPPGQTLVNVHAGVTDPGMDERNHGFRPQLPREEFKSTGSWDIYTSHELTESFEISDPESDQLVVRTYHAFNLQSVKLERLE